MMKNFVILTESIDFIERNLCEPITRNEIARHCHVSLSSLEKLYGYALKFGIRHYIERRRITQAAKDIVQSEMNLTDIAMKYQFNSPEVFSRAFRRVWNVNPSDFSDRWKFTGIFPRINFEHREGEDIDMAKKRVDMSEAYDYLKERKDSWVLCFDCQHLTAFNNISRKAGDLAILEEAARIDQCAGDDMLVLRVGGDEFALITGLYDEAQAKALADKVLAKNGGVVEYEGRELPLSLWCGMMKIPERLRYSEFFQEIHTAIDGSKK